MIRAKPAAVIAIMLSAAIHAGIIGGLAYGVKLKGTYSTDKKNIEVIITDKKADSGILPPVIKRAEETKIKKSEEKPAEQAAPSGNAPVQGLKDGASGESVMNYRDMVRRRLQENRRYPHAARSAGVEGSVGVRFAILKSGAVGFVAVESASGSAWLDSSAVDAVKNSSPFPALPESYQADEMEFTVNIIYRLK